MAIRGSIKHKDDEIDECYQNYMNGKYLKVTFIELL